MLQSVDDFLLTSKFFPDWFVTNKKIKKLYSALFTDDDILFFDEDSGCVTFSSEEMGILSVDLNNINLHHTTVMKMILKLLFMSYLWLGTTMHWSPCICFGLRFIRY